MSIFKSMKQSRKGTNCFLEIDNDIRFKNLNKYCKFYNKICLSNYPLKNEDTIKLYDGTINNINLKNYEINYSITNGDTFIDIIHEFYNKITLIQDTVNNKICEEIDITMFDYELKINKFFEVKLKNLDGLEDFFCMFYGSQLLYSLPYISKLNTKNIMSFNGFRSFERLPDVLNWDTSNDVPHLKKLPYISKWNANNVEKMASLFEECSSLKALPDISNWNTEKTQKINFLFNFYNLVDMTAFVAEKLSGTRTQDKDILKACEQMKIIEKRLFSLKSVLQNFIFYSKNFKKYFSDFNSSIKLIYNNSPFYNFIIQAKFEEMNKKINTLFSKTSEWNIIFDSKSKIYRKKKENKATSEYEEISEKTFNTINSSLKIAYKLANPIIDEIITAEKQLFEEIGISLTWFSNNTVRLLKISSSINTGCNASTTPPITKNFLCGRARKFIIRYGKLTGLKNTA
ncbi:hypothetical protein H8356DRAFT_1340163 [Neocallimastix lanati (nom. inval.)]|nr:hypothetical protein H8356DRAFT_1340163 [Neocallimastix sp. JGI-2020a]